MFLMGGDFGQLPPVLDKALHSSKSGSSNTSRIGHLAFNALDTYLLLDQPERQGAHSPLFTALSNLRAGVTTVQDEAFWGSRSLLTLRHQQPPDSTEWDYTILICFMQRVTIVTATISTTPTSFELTR